MKAVDDDRKKWLKRKKDDRRIRTAMNYWWRTNRSKSNECEPDEDTLLSFWKEDQELLKDFAKFR